MENAVPDLTEVTSVEFQEALDQLIALESAQLDALEHLYAAQTFCIAVLSVIAVLLLLYNVIKNFM